MMTVYMFTFVLILCIILAQRYAMRMMTIEKAIDPYGILLTKTAIEADISKHSPHRYIKKREKTMISSRFVSAFSYFVALQPEHV